MEPITTVTAALSLTKSATDLSKRLYEFGKSIKDREQKHQVEEMTDALTEFKRSASLLEDENRELREKLRFKSDDYVFQTPFYYRKDHPDEPLCAKCFADDVEGHMGEVPSGFHHRTCLVCGTSVNVGQQDGGTALSARRRRAYSSQLR
jgi:hypothetical protein